MVYMWLRSDFPKFVKIGEIMYMCVWLIVYVTLSRTYDSKSFYI